MQTLVPKGEVVAGVEDAWEAMVLMVEGMESSDVHKEDKKFGRQVGVQETCY